MIPRMNYQQYRTARRLLNSCCNYDCGNCLLLDDGEECVCPQSTTYSLICKWFRAAVLPLDVGLRAALFYRDSMKRCAICGSVYLPKSNRAKYCQECAKYMKRTRATERKRKQRQQCHALEQKKPL